MDVNGTQLHLLLGMPDWQATIVPPADPAVCFDPARNTLGLRPRPFVFPTRPDAPRLTPADRRGAAVDQFGNRLWVGPGHDEILALGTGRADAFRYWSARAAVEEPTSSDGFTACRPQTDVPPVLAGLVVTASQYLVVGATGLPTPSGATAAGLLVFDLAGGGPPVVATWRSDLDVRPFDIAALPDGGFVILDVDESAPGPARLWWFDARHRVVDLAGIGTPPAGPIAFAPVDPAVAPVTVARTPLGTVDPRAAVEAHAVAIDANWAVAVDALPDGSVVVLDRMGPDGRLDVGRWLCGQQQPFGLRIAEDAGGPLDLACSDQRANAADLLDGAVGHDLAVQTGTDGGSRLMVVDELGDQAFEFVVGDDGADLVADYHPLRLFGGKGLIGSHELTEYDLAHRWFPVPVRPVDRFATAAQVVLAPQVDGPAGPRGFDARVEGTVWHRVLLDATIPVGTSVTVETRAADDLTVLERRPWDREPAPYLRGDGSEIAYHRYPDGEPCADQGTWELLVQRAVGRYLQVRLTIRGDGRRTPRIWALRVHAPRFSYLGEYLPDIFRSDRDSASFLDRYLANVEGMYTTLEGRIVDVQRLFDPSATDPEFLPWLASWVGGAVEPDWEPERVRLFVRHAARLFSHRGTARGLVEAIRLATHPCPTDAIFDARASCAAFDVRVVEAFRTRSVPAMTYGDPGDLAGPRLRIEGPWWDVADGRSGLERRWSDFLADRYPATGDGASLSARVAAAWSGSTGVVGIPPRFPVLTPTGTVAARDWRDFVRSKVSMPYPEVGAPADLADYRKFLEQRYRRVEDLHAAWNLQGASKPGSFGAVGFPVGLPADGVPLQDWITFVSSVLPIRRNAHRCSVLVPIRFDDSDEKRAERLGRVRRVVDADRPAHTLVHVEPYWAALRVGEARVGFETIVGEGGRYVDLVLGTGRLAHAAVPGGRTWRLDGRVVVERDRIERSVEPAGTGAMT